MKLHIIQNEDAEHTTGAKYIYNTFNWKEYIVTFYKFIIEINVI